MAKHEFGMMPHAPDPHEQFFLYEPGKYNCISVDDEQMEKIMNRLTAADCYWGTMERPGKGLDYCGITLIPPESLDAILMELPAGEDYQPLCALLQQAKKENSFVIHFGI